MSLSFQDLILTLHHYWGEQGCVILQPYDMEMGAGTFHPATVLRALGPDPWKAPMSSRAAARPTAAMARTPTGCGHYYQYQVMLKPSPADLQELYLGSLDAIGIDPLKHDIRFVEDDWESPTLGAWGLGWEVWCDGMEVTQFTYFQQVGGFDCKPVAGELTYGLERLAMYIQGKDNVFDLDFNDDGVTYGDVFLENEKQMSKWNFEVADTEALFDLFKKAAAECENCLDGRRADRRPMSRRSRPATCSTRCRRAGVISVAERQAYIGRVRDLAKGACGAWMDAHGVCGVSADFLLELLSEEIPARMQARARNDLARMFAEALAAAGLGHERRSTTYSTPRRLALIARGLPPATEAVSEELKGPRTSAPPQALEGFLRKTGLTQDQLEERDGIWFAVIDRPGRATARGAGRGGRRDRPRLPLAQVDALGRGVASTASLRWVRPLHSIVALLGEEIVPVEIDGVAVRRDDASATASTIPAPITIGGAHDYVEKLRACHVIVDQDEREAIIRDGAARRPRTPGLTLVEDEGLVVENAGLTEWPVPLLGSFDPDFLDVPRR